MTYEIEISAAQRVDGVWVAVGVYRETGGAVKAVKKTRIAAVRRVKSEVLRDFAVLLDAGRDVESIQFIEKREDDDSDDGIAFEALEIGRSGTATPQEVTRLRAFLKHLWPHVREAAAEALGKIDARAAVPEICDLLADRSQPVAVRDTCAYALSLLQDPASEPVLRRVLAEPDLAPTLRDRTEDALLALAQQDDEGSGG